MSWLISLVFGRLPIGWLQLTHNRGRFIAAVSGVAFANLLVFMQLGIMGALNDSTVAPYSLLNADIILSSEDGNTLTDSGHIPRVRMFQALSVAGVAQSAPLFIGNLPFTLDDGSTVSLLNFGVDTAKPNFASSSLTGSLRSLNVENTALLDQGTRGMPRTVIDDLTSGGKFSFETGGNTLTVVGTMEVGGGFLADGMMMMSDQTFLRFFPKRSSRAPNHILIQTEVGVATDVVVARLQNALPAGNIKIQSMKDAAANDLIYMSTKRPTGIIFGFGVFMGVLVGLVIVYQVLSTDVADHLREYATFKAMGFGQQFFLGIVLEEAIILGIFGFIPGFIVSMGLYAGLVSITGLPVMMSASRAIMVFLGTIVACSASGAIATRRLAQADPADLF
tara:strand:+ start:30349 stop:31524 length:1176 start_codon:yes stop_codon:yes gene_type:complete